MNLNALTRPLDISEIDFRVQSINGGGYATILAYKDARTDMNRLDEAFGPYGWQRDYKLVDTKLFCGVSIFHEQSYQWIWKWDVGVESNTEKEKGQASDAFKRACFNLGIGRELYDYPVISIKLNEDEWEKDKFSGKAKQTWNLRIRDWRWYSEFTDGKITFLAAKDDKGKLRFTWGVMKPKEVEPEYKASAVSEQPIEAEPTAPVQIKGDDANIAGILKPKPEVDEEREKAIAEYTAVVGKPPHHKMTTENILKAINEQINENIEEPAQEEEIEEPVVETDIPIGLESIRDEFSKIETIKDTKQFVAWAKETVAKYIDIDSEEAINEFKELCNNHYAKIK